MKVYVASSWRNGLQPEVVRYLRSKGHDVYDFRNPAPGNTGFQSWNEAELERDSDGLCTLSQLADGHRHSVAEAAFKCDFDAMQAADACVLVLPSGRSAHLEAGWFMGQGRPVIVYAPENQKVEPELMYKMGSKLTCHLWILASLLEEA